MFHEDGALKDNFNGDFLNIYFFLYPFRFQIFK